LQKFDKELHVLGFFVPSGGTFALYSLISRYARICLIPNQQAEDELVLRYKHHPKPSATLRRAQWMKNLLETSKAAKISLFFLTILATALAISDCMLNPPISGNRLLLHKTLTKQNFVVSLVTSHACLFQYICGSQFWRQSTV
jgi:hypothetical protein